MTDNEQIKHNLLLNIKRLEGILERIDKFCHNYDQEKVDASVAVLKIKSAIENLREVIPEMSKDAESINQKVSEEENKETGTGGGDLIVSFGRSRCLSCFGGGLA